MRFYYDCEFIEDGKTIDLISIGIVSELGDEFYGVSSEFDESRADDFVEKNVLPSLPPAEDRIDRVTLAVGVLTFLRKHAGNRRIELWADYSAYDHVALCQLLGGKMVNLPAGVPMFTHDLQHEIALITKHRGSPISLPMQADGQHNAISDARHLLAQAREVDLYR